MDNIITDILLAFLFGGLICIPAQLLIDLTRLTPAKILVLYVSIGVVVYAVGAYDWLYNIFGRGISVPLIGFGANIGKGVKEAVDSTGFLGILSGGITAASAGISLSLLLGILFSVIFKPKQRRM